jgi:hypothetical protein
VTFSQRPSGWTTPSIHSSYVIVGQLHDANDFDNDQPSQECSALQGEYIPVLTGGQDTAVGEYTDVEKIDDGRKGAQWFD